MIEYVMIILTVVLCTTSLLIEASEAFEEATVSNG